MGRPRFEEFFQAIHGYPPFPWQARLADHVVSNGWPSLLDLPTGSGKTSALDVALYAMAVAPERSPRRVFLVVDRRIIVDQGAIHARKILARLRDGAAADITERLLELFEPAQGQGRGDPFQVAVLRGGMPREDEWARRPDQPVLGASTVDQVGSRLLFRGYGVNPRMASVHAGLLGNDTLLLLDEVQLAQPFAETLGAIATRWMKGPLGDKFSFIRMSATPGRPDPSSFGIDAADREHPVLAKRLVAQKRARLAEVKVSGTEDARRTRFSEECVKEVLRCLDEDAKVIGVVVNRVDTARQIWHRLHERGSQAFDVVLLTGRMRPLDRDLVLDGEHGVLARAGANGRGQRPCPRPLILVATQCIEAGADFDFDALVTECASIDALRQRFGRLDRLGELGVSNATILLRSDHADPKTDDPVYGTSLPETWHWLRDQGDEVSFGIDEMDRRLATAVEVRDRLVPDPERAPVLLPAHLDMWAQTSPQSSPDPEVALWLHGPDTGVPDVQLVWRADIREEALSAAAESQSAKSELDDLITQVAACPPNSLEALSVPMYAARAWLLSLPVPEIDDAVNRSGELELRPEAPAGALVLHWLGDRSRVVHAAELNPGATLVVPAERGGIGALNWAPDARDPVVDLGDLAQLEGRGRATLRTHPDVLKVWGLDDDARQTAPMHSEIDDVDEELHIREWLEGLPDAAPEGGRKQWTVVRQGLLGKRRVVELPNRRYAMFAPGRYSIGETTEDDDSSFIESPVTLREHCSDVRRWTERFARSLNLGRPLAADLALAAWLHDVGKADPRFQLWLMDGNPVRHDLLEEPLAKSVGSSRDRRSREQARKRAQYPIGYRHELLSLAMAESSTSLFESANDPDLVLHLIASHHGWARPFAPVAREDSPDIEVSLEHEGEKLTGLMSHRFASIDSGVSDRFWALTERYGWWGLAGLEAILRLADHRASEERVG